MLLCKARLKGRLFAVILNRPQPRAILGAAQIVDRLEITRVAARPCLQAADEGRTPLQFTAGGDHVADLSPREARLLARADERVEFMRVGGRLIIETQTMIVSGVL